jgi:stage II sporulation protein AA (anti-sigma F factor antagonist)
MNELATITSTPTDEALTITIDGEVDMSNAADIEDEIRERADGAALVVLDLSDVSFFDSSGIRMLFAVRQQLRGAGTAMAVVAPEGSRVSEVLDVARVDNAAPVFRSQRSAVAAMGAG